MATTTNYGWTTPDDTDLVKDGASAIRTLGTAIDTTTKNLNPETTLGDISYRSSTANTNTRLGIGTTGQILTVVAGVPSWATAGPSIPANDAATVATSQTTTSTSYTDLATAGPAVTVTTGTKALVIVTAYGTPPAAASNTMYMSYGVTGATTSAAVDTRAVAWFQTDNGQGQAHRASAASVVTLTAGSNTFTAKYRITGSTATFKDRDIFVMNLA
jgi:hypothetical protein